MATSLNVIALISGGKDSLFSILHCQAHGHTIVALANLHPTSEPAGGRDAENESEHEDIDSYMYQTVGHGIIPLYEKALGIPLYRQEIAGKAVNSSRDYEQQEQDETEDLVPLLRRVMQEHPEANAVSTGAILSTYQRTRVESVALRLGLTPMSFLWQYPLLPPYSQSVLLHDMSAVGQEAVIIKTASGGLDETFLGLDVASQRTIAKLSKTMARFGEAGNGAIVGEGGEFETLALDGPVGMWKSKIVIEKSETRVVNGGQTVLKIVNSRLEEKEGDREGALDALRIPELWDDEFKRVLDATRKKVSDTTVSANATDSETALPSDSASAISTLSTNTYTNTRTTFTFSNLTSGNSASSDVSPSRQLTNILLRLDHILKNCQLLKSSINHCTLLLRSMSDFTILNPVYAQYFDDINPPARVTVATGNTMPKSVDVMLSVILDKAVQDPDKRAARQGLHVQSRSYWAPANIGPYSQAISVPFPAASTSSSSTSNAYNLSEEEEGSGGTGDTDAGEIVYIAGQIPLVPSTMEPFTSDGFCGQALLSLQHLWRIGRAKGVRNWTAGVAFIPESITDADTCVRIAHDCWKQLHTAPLSQDEIDDDEDEGQGDIDPWDQLNSHTGATFKDTTHRVPIPDYTTITTTSTPSSSHYTPPCFIAQISSLPRNVAIEWSASGLTSSSLQFDEKSLKPAHSSSRFLSIEIAKKEDWERVKGMGWASATLYVGREWEDGWNRELRGVQWIPCFRVWGGEEKEVRGVVVGRVDGEVDDA
jgi:diphthine-ammonia ligase